LPHRDLDPDAREEADEHRARDEVGEEAEPRDPREQQEAARNQGSEAGICQPLVRVGREARDAEPGDAGVEDRGRRRVATDREVAR